MTIGMDLGRQDEPVLPALDQEGTVAEGEGSVAMSRESDAASVRERVRGAASRWRWEYIRRG